jgi:hypothetical protein
MTADRLEGRTIHSADGEKLGKVDDVLVDDGGQPRYVRVRTGWIGGKHHMIPIEGISESGDDLTTTYSRGQLEGAPTFDDDEDVDYDRERALGGHYGHGVRDWDDSRDRWLSGEDLSRGPTPETRHPAGHTRGDDFAERGDRGETGGADDVRDTTQGPTPETRRAMRMTDDDSAAAMQPSADRGTRADVGGNQDTDLDTRGRGRDAGMGMGDSDAGATGMTGSERGMRDVDMGERRIRLARWRREDATGVNPGMGARGTGGL